MVEVGFGDADLRDSYSGGRAVVDEVAVQVLVVQAAGAAPMAIACSDLCVVWPLVALRLRQAVAASAGTTVDQVGVFNTQNHGTPFTSPKTFNIEALSAAYAQATRLAVANLQPAQVAYAAAPSPDHTIIARRKVVAGVGAFTFWFGFEPPADCARLLRAAIDGLAAHDEMTRKCPQGDGSTEPLPPVPMDGVTDRLIQGLAFRSRDGEPIGTLSRWSAHPATATGLTSQPGGDYPVYLRAALRRGFGGRALFLTGPCGDQCVPVQHKSVELAQRIGGQLADRWLQALATAAWQPLTTAAAGSLVVDLPMRHDRPRTLAEARSRHSEARVSLQRARAGGAALPELKRLAEDVETLSYYAEQHYLSWTGIDIDEMAGGIVSHPLFAVRLNDCVVVGLPGEPVGSYSRTLRQRLAQVKVITAEECNGYLSYLPAAADYANGGYEVCAAIVDAKAEESVLGAASDLVARLF